MRDIFVGVVSLEEFLFGSACSKHRHVPVDVLLTPIDDANETKLERVDSASENIKRVCPIVHQVELREDTNGSQAAWIDRAGQLQAVRICQIHICR